MAKAILTVSVERGRDPREYTLIAFGGAGPIHCCDLAEELEINNILVPVHAGIFSAYGLLAANITRTFSLPVLTTDILLEPYFDEARKMAFTVMKNDGFPKYTLKEYVDARYKGQSYELRLPYEKLADMKSRFSEKHKEVYGYSSNDEIEIVNVRVKAVINTSGLKMRRAKYSREEGATPIGYRETWTNGNLIKIPVYSREKLKPETIGKGPSIIEEYDSTLVVNPKWTWKVHEFGIELKR